MSSIDRFKEKSITASIVEDTQDSTKVLLTVQVTHKAVRQAAISHPKKIGDRAFFHFVAFEILKETDPIALFDYYIKEDSLLGKADTLLKYLNDNSEFRKDRTNQFRLDVSTINFKLAKAHYLRRESRKKMVSDDDEANNDSEQRKMRDEALRLAHELIENNPNDLSAYVQEFSCLAFSCNWLYYLDPEEDKHDINQGKIDSVEWKKHFDELLADFKGKEKSLNTEFYDDAHSRAYIKATIGYLEQYFYQISDDKDDKIELHYKEALEISKEEDVFILNSAAYFYANREIRKRKKAYNYIEKAINLRPYDGNLMDSYADIALSFGDTAKFYKYFEKALENQKPIDGITIQEYEKDTRLKKMWDKPEFRALMRKYKSRIFDEPINEAETSDLAAETPQTKPKPLAVKWLKRKKKP